MKHLIRIASKEVRARLHQGSRNSRLYRLPICSGNTNKSISSQGCAAPELLNEARVILIESFPRNLEAG